LFRSLQIDCAGGYLDSRPKIRLAGDGIPKAAGRAKQLMKNLPRDGCRKSPGEDFDFLRLSAGSALLQSNVQYPRGDREWDAHASYHLDGTLHHKSYGAVVGVPQKCQPLTGAFKGSEHLGVFMGHGASSGAVCDPAAFTGVVIVEPGVLG
jgi:hypothetical protein